MSIDQRRETKPNRGRVILVTGASSGIGRACATHLAQRGFRVLGTTRRVVTDGACELHQVPFGPGEVEMLTMDVDDPASVHRTVERVLMRGGRIDGLVNAAGFGIAGPVEETADDEAKAIFETNLFGTLRVCRAVLPSMRKQCSGTIINVSSIAGRIAVPFQGLYSATKAAVEGMTEALRMEVRGFGVRVVLIEPGDFCTGFTDRRQRVRGAVSNSAYAGRFESALSVAESDERCGKPPEAVARLVERVLVSRSPRVRYTVGPGLQRAAVRLKCLLPSRLFERALMTYYRVR